MWLRLIDKQNFVSPAIHIQHDHEEFLKVVYEWREKVWALLENDPEVSGMPLGRLDAGTCMFDLIRHLGEYYIKTDPSGRTHVWACLTLEDQPLAKENRAYVEDMGNELVEIKTYSVDVGEKTYVGSLSMDSRLMDMQEEL
jgi:hypothetical protein